MMTTPLAPKTKQGRTRCEVWTRVMGYHRPVSQYNVGKKSEFYSRVYSTEASGYDKHFKKTYDQSFILVTTTTCPKCPQVKELVQNNNVITGKIIDETTPGFSQIVSTYRVTEAPTLLILDSEAHEIWRGTDVQEIEKYLTC